MGVIYPGIPETGTVGAILGEKQLREQKKARRLDAKVAKQQLLVDIAGLGLGASRMGSDIGLSLARQGAEIEEQRRARGFTAEESVLDRANLLEQARIQASPRLELDFVKDMREQALADAMEEAERGNIPRELSGLYGTPGTPEHIGITQLRRLDPKGELYNAAALGAEKGPGVEGSAETLQKILENTPEQDQDEVVREVLRRMRSGRPDFPTEMEIEGLLGEAPLPAAPSPAMLGASMGMGGNPFAGERRVSQENIRRKALRETIRKALQLEKGQ
jgi:hypothetical protein